MNEIFDKKSFHRERNKQEDFFFAAFLSPLSAYVFFLELKPFVLFYSLAACRTKHPEIFVAEKNIIKFSAKKRKPIKPKVIFIEPQTLPLFILFLFFSSFLNRMRILLCQCAYRKTAGRHFFVCLFFCVNIRFDHVSFD